MTEAWLVRAGERGETWETDIGQGITAIGWHEVGDLSKTASRQDIAIEVRKAYPNASSKRISNWTGQLYRFRHEIAAGDLVVTPLRQTNTIAVGEVTGDYEYRPDLPEEARHTHPVRWLRVDLARTLFGQDLLYSLGSLLTVARVSRNDAARRIAYLAKHEHDPGASLIEAVFDQEAEPASIDLERLAYDRINSHIAENFSGHAMAELVEAILKAQGLTTYRSPKGPDGGIDVLAGGGPLGMDPPRICVQVKFTAGPADASTVRELEGVMNRVRADQGLLVTWNGITQAAEREVRQQFFRVRVWTADDVLRELTSVYDQLPEEIQIRLPLKPVWMLAVQGSIGAEEG